MPGRISSRGISGGVVGGLATASITVASSNITKAPLLRKFTLANLSRLTYRRQHSEKCVRVAIQVRKLAWVAQAPDSGD
jgi:hypothetical protein